MHAPSLATPQETVFAEAVRRHAAALGCRPPTVRFSPPPGPPDVFGTLIAGLYARGFIAVHVVHEGTSLIFVDGRMAWRLSHGALSALAAHETAHAADYLLSWRRAILGRVLPEGPHRRLETWAEPLHEAFANRAAAAVAGAGNLHALHVEASALMGMPVPDAVPPALPKGLPPSLRLARLLGGSARTNEAPATGRRGSS